MRSREWVGRTLVITAAVAVVANAGIALTGALVRLTGSGLGCPTWPQCSSGSLVPTAEFGIHGAIEFGNRMLAFVVGGIAAVALIMALLDRPVRRPLVWLSVGLFGGIAANAVIGGITVLTGLNPWIVSVHFLPAPILVAVAYTLFVRARESGDGPKRWLAPPAARWLARLIIAAAGVTVVLGTIVTGSGPHAGDPSAGRNGLDPEWLSRIHSGAAITLVLATVVALVVFVRVGAPKAAQRAIYLLLVVEAAQVAIGYAQYFLSLPIALVALHVAGAMLLWAVALRPLYKLQRRSAPESADAASGAESRDDQPVDGTASSAGTEPASSEATIASANRSAAPSA